MISENEIEDIFAEHYRGKYSVVQQETAESLAAISANILTTDLVQVPGLAEYLKEKL